MRTFSGVGIYSEYFAAITKRPPSLRLQNGPIPDVRKPLTHPHAPKVEKPSSTRCETLKPADFTYSIITKIHIPSSRKKAKKPAFPDDVVLAPVLCRKGA